VNVTQEPKTWKRKKEKKKERKDSRGRVHSEPSWNNLMLEHTQTKEHLPMKVFLEVVVVVVICYNGSRR
jgi:hypothetical protein